MGNAFAYVIGLGASVMMPVIFTVLGVCIGIKFSRALKSGLLAFAMCVVNFIRIRRN